MPSARSVLASKGQTAKVFCKTRKKEIQLVYRFTLTLVIIPAFLAAIGAIVERVIYGTVNRPNFSPVLMLCGGYIAAPFILVRWFWPTKMKEHIEKLEFLFYILFSVGFFVAIITTTVAGNELFFTGKHVRSVFGGKNSEQFMAINSRDDVYDWLGMVFRRVYDKRANVNDGSRELPGRLLLNGPIRLNQYRTASKPCSKKVKSMNLVSTEQCFTSDEQDTATYSKLNFTYQNTNYTNYVGDEIFASDITLKGTLDTYPLAGHWVLFKPSFSLATVEQMLAALQANNWIDGQTRMVSLDCTLIAPDFPQTTVVSMINIIEVTKSGFFVPVAPHVNFNYLDDASGDDDTDKSTGATNMTQSSCDATKHPAFFIPVYLGILPGLVYTIFMHCQVALDSWRKYLHSPFTYSELAWFITVILSISFRWRSIYYDHCTVSELFQDVYPGNRSEIVIVFEFIQIGHEWFESRRVLGLALFLHLFNLLKFIVQIPALSQLIRTLKLAFSELASFSLSFLVVFFAFVFMFYIIFSVESSDYQNIPRCIATLWLGMLGELSITPELWRVKEWTIPMIILFIFISVFVLLTVIVAIISDAHERSRMQREKEEERRRELAKNALDTWGKLFRRRKNGKQQAGGGSDGHALSVFSPSSGHHHGDRGDVGFSSIVGLAVAAKRKNSDSSNVEPFVPSPDIREGSERSGLEPGKAADPETTAVDTRDSAASTTGLLSLSKASADECSDRDQTVMSKMSAKSAARFLSARQTQRRQRDSQEQQSATGLVSSKQFTLPVYPDGSTATAVEDSCSGSGPDVKTKQTEPEQKTSGSAASNQPADSTRQETAGQRDSSDSVGSHAADPQVSLV